MKKAKKIILVIFCAISVFIGSITIYYWNDINDIYREAKGAHTLQWMVQESEEAYKAYLYGDSNAAIKSLEQYKQKLETELQTFPEDKRLLYININTIKSDLSVVYGRLAMKYEELGDEQTSQKYLDQACKYSNPYSKDQLNADEMRKFIKTIDDNMLNK